MAIHILLFAKLAEQCGAGEDSLVFVANETASDAFERLQQKYDKALSPQGVRVAVNQDFVPWDRVLNEGDEVAFIPPVAGG